MEELYEPKSTMHTRSRTYILGFLLVALLFVVTRSFPFWSGTMSGPLDVGSGVPLGYDPGLYKMMRQAYQALGANRDFALLPHRISVMYEPLLGMRGSLLGHVLGTNPGITGSASGEIVRSDSILTRGRVAVIALLPLGMYAVGRRISKQVAVFALILGVLSFTQRYVFWRGYWKQLVGIFLVLMVFYLRMRNKAWASVPLCAAVFLVNRPAAVLLTLVGIGLALREVYTKRNLRLAGVGLVSVLIALPIGRTFWNTQILSLLGAFWSSIDVPNWNDTYQQGGSFLTTHEYLQAAWRAIFAGMGSMTYWLYRSVDKDEQGKISLRSGFGIIVGATLLLLLRVGGQGFFFQRMIGYLDVFLLLMTAYGLGKIRDRMHGQYIGGNMLYRSLRRVIAIDVFLLAIITGYYQRTKIPHRLIEPEELRFIKTLDALTPQNAIIIVPSRWYSPWIGGRSQREVIAPALFDINTRSLDEWRHVWLERPQDGSQEGICTNIKMSYRHLARPLYVITGKKEPIHELAASCMQEVAHDAASGMILYYVQ